MSGSVCIIIVDGDDIGVVDGIEVSDVDGNDIVIVKGDDVVVDLGNDIGVVAAVVCTDVEDQIGSSRIVWR